MTGKEALSAVQAVITHRGAMNAVEGALSKAEELKVRINVAVVDSGGNLAGFARMPGSFLVSIGMCQQKARSAAGLGIAPDLAEQILQQEAPRVREGLLGCDGFSLIGGGLPLFADGALIGGIGVSGGSEAQDIQCAQAGAAAIDSVSGQDHGERFER